MTIGPYYLNDSPATPVEVDLISDEDVTGYNTTVVVLVSPTGHVVPVTALYADETVLFTIPAHTLTEAGVWHARIKLLGGESLVTLPSVPFVVQALDGWHNLDSARAEWDQAPLSDVTLYSLLETARIECEAFAPERSTIPANFRAAQLLQARNSLNAGQVQPSGDFGEGSFQMTPFPMDWKVKQLLRPKTGRPLVG